MRGGGFTVMEGGPALDVRTADEIDEIAEGLRGAAMALLYAGESKSCGNSTVFCEFMTSTLDGYADRLHALTHTGGGQAR